jgi:MoxR-like ATPase
VDANKSCTNCPAFLQADEGVRKFKKSIGAPVCGRYGIPLGKPGMKKSQGDKLAVHFANRCDSYGEPMPPEPVEERFLVVLPDPKTREGTVDEDKAKMCTSCAMCKNFVRDDTVADELGWSVGLCAAKGKLILPSRQVAEARGCGYKEFGPIRRSTMGLMLLPEYEDAFQVNVDPVKAYFKGKTAGSFVDPREYPTDREVSEEDATGGIRAWRKIVDPNGSGNEVFLPVYREDFFEEDDRAKIPRTGDDEHPELYVDHFGGLYTLGVLWTETDDTPCLIGEAGVGKTELYRHIAWLMCTPFERFSITAKSELEDLAGSMRYEAGTGTYFSYGRLVRAWQKPCVVCLDEPNTGPPEVWQFLRPLTDNSKQLVLDQNNGEHVKRHTDCYLGMAMNPAWDPKNIGATEIGDADVSRLMHVYVELPPPILEREIIKNRVKIDGWELSEDQIDTLMSIAEDIRGQVKEETIPITWGIRPQLKVARLLRWFDWITAYRRAVGDFLEEQAREILLDQVRAHVES